MNTSFVDLKHKMHVQHELNDNFKSIDTPVGFKNIVLYPHQRVVIQALIDLEDKRVLTLDTDAFDNYTHRDVIIESNSLVLSEPFGTGKTIEILGWILYKPIPRAMPTHVNITLGNRGDMSQAVGFSHEIIRKFTGPNALIRPNLIIVGASVLSQWEKAINNFTNLKVFVIGNSHHLQTFYKLFVDNKTKIYDIVLLKNGTVTGSFIVPGEDISAIKDHRPLISVMGIITESCCWSRVIYDDFDTIKIPSGARAINALFTVYVSATTKKTSVPNPANVVYKNLTEALRSNRPILNNITCDLKLFTNFNIKNNKDFVEMSTKIPIINKNRYVYANPDDNYIKLLGAMRQEDANHLMEMLNGDALSTAAETMGIKSTNIADIFSRMLDKKYDRYMNDKYVLNTIEKFRREILPVLKPFPENENYSNAEILLIRDSLIKKKIPECEYYSNLLEELLDELQAEYVKLKEIDGITIGRVIDNIKEGQCQICCLPIDDSPAFIVKCCGLIVCDVCGIKGNRIGYRYDYKLKCNTMMGSCANCKSTIYPRKDLIFVDRDFNIENLIEATGDEKIEEPFIETPMENEIVKIKNPKLKALLDIVEGRSPDNKEPATGVIKSLLEGRVDIPQDQYTEKKVLVFAGFNETLNNIENFLVEHNVEFLRLGGTYKEMSEMVQIFKTSGKVLLVNSSQHCAGLNLQFSSDLVFMHKIMNSNVESQVAGRAMRIGRTCNLHIHYLCYSNEKILV